MLKEEFKKQTPFSPFNTYFQKCLKVSEGQAETAVLKEAL